MLRECLLWYEQRFGRKALLAVAAELPPELARVVQPALPALGILTSAWYPVALCHRLLDRIAEARGGQGRALAREVSREVVLG